MEEKRMIYRVLEWKPVRRKPFEDLAVDGG
jgi:hypothetical protein